MSTQVVLPRSKFSMDDPFLSAFPFESVVIEAGKRPIGFRFSKHIVNIIAQLAGQNIIATGEDESYDVALAKAKSELIERAALLTYGHQFASTTSNGWAAHPDPIVTRQNATCELVERDAVLAHWYSSTPFMELTLSSLPADIREWATTELGRSEYPIFKLLLTTLGLGPSVTCLFVNKQGYGVSAHSTRSTLEESIRSAIAEACRPAHSSIRKEHWKNTLKLKLGEGDPRACEAHALYYAYHEPFPHWMFGDKIEWDDANKQWNRKIYEIFGKELGEEQSEFTFTSVLTLPTSVGFACHPKAFELCWGNTDVKRVASQEAAKRIGLNEIYVNKNVHIVA